MMTTLKMFAVLVLPVFVMTPGPPVYAAAEPLPIVPGAHGFGMETPAGSGRHLEGVELKQGWDDSLAGHWDFDGDAPQTGDLTGDAAVVSRGPGKALRLNGKGSLRLAKPAGYAEAGGSFTVMAWVKLTENGGFVAANEVEGKGYWRLGHSPIGGGKWMFWVRNADGESHHLAHRFTNLGRWRHLAGVYNGKTGRFKLYFNGRLVNRAQRKVIKNLFAARSNHLTIGRGVRGMIDDVMFFDAALTGEEIAALHGNQYSSYFGSARTRVIKVTNLDAEGPGSLRAALAAEGPRVVVFEVSGNIDFTPFTNLSINNPYLIVAGQTAPSPGITLKGCQLLVRTHDVLVQHIRVRTGDLGGPPVKRKSGWTQYSERDCMKVSGERIVFDHCSFSWSTDENVQSNASHLTFRHCISSEGLNSPKHHKGGHSKGLLFRGTGNDRSQQVAVIGCLFAHNHGRNPRMAGAARAAVINNLIYDVWHGVEIAIHSYPKSDERDIVHMTTLLGNHAIEGEHGRTFVPNYRGHEKVVERKRIPSDFTIIPLLMLARNNAPPGKVFIDDFRVSYTDEEGEYFDEMITDPLNSKRVQVWKSWMGKPLEPGKSMVDEPPVVVPGLKIRPSSEVEEWVLANAGARPADRDAVDDRIVRDVRERTGTIPKSQEDVGGWPKLEVNRRELTVPDQPNEDDDGDGYTNLEEWLHGFSVAVEVRADH